MRRCLAAGVVTLSLLTACKSVGDDAESSATEAAGATDTSGGSSDTSSGSSDTSVGAGAVASDDPRAPGVAADKLTVGITYVDLSRIGDLLKIDHGDYEAAYTAMIEEINAGGGIHGRMIEVVFAPVQAQGGTAGAEAACTQLTQDNEIFVAVGFFRDDNVLCYLDTNPVPVIGGAMTAERIGKAKVAWYTVEAGEDSESDAVRALADADELGDKVAVVALAADQNSLDGTIEPLMTELGVPPIETALLDAPANDPAANYAAAEVIAQRFEEAGAEQVLVLGNAPPAFVQGLLRTDYRPQLVFGSLNAISTYTFNEGNDMSILEGAIAGATFDAGNTFLEMDGVTKECVDNQVAAGLELKHVQDVPAGDPTQFTSSFIACRQIVLLEAILQKAGPQLDYGTFRAAGDSLGSIELAGFPDPLNFGAPPSADGDPKAYVYEWDGAAVNFVLSED